MLCEGVVKFLFSNVLVDKEQGFRFPRRAAHSKCQVGERLMRMRLLVACLTSTFLAAVPVPRVDPSPPPPPPPPPSPPPPPLPPLVKPRQLSPLVKPRPRSNLAPISPLSSPTSPLNASSGTSMSSRPLVIVLGMPKTGTESIAKFFTCNKWKSSHWTCPGHGYCGQCLLRWVAAVAGSSIADGADLLREACGDFDVFSQIDYEPSGACLFPQVTYLPTLLRYLPNAYFVLNTRPTAHWLSSVAQWGNMLERLTQACPINPRNSTGLGQWYEAIIVRASQALRTQCRCPSH